MKDILLRFTSLFLVVVLAIGNTPVSFHHDHEESSHCDHEENLHEVDACHLSIYHSNEVEENCDHNAHFSTDHQDCELCSLLSSKRQKYQLVRLQSFEANIKVLFLDFSTKEFIENNAVSLRYGRAPPVLC